jgi:SAM-dependent methyltransferase
MKFLFAASLIFLVSCDAFTPPTKSRLNTAQQMVNLDVVTSLRTEWVSAALCTNQTPRAADTCLQLGVQDGRIVTFVPRTIREIITSSLEKDGQLTVAQRRQLQQTQDRRNAGRVTFVDQRADDLCETPDDSIDVVVSLQSAEKMLENGLDWKKSIREAARVLKPGGRFLFVERTEVNGENYLEYVENLYSVSGETPDDGRPPIFEEVGYDDVDLVLTPHIAGVAIKSENAGLTAEQIAKRQAQQEKERLADLSIEAYERGIKRRKKKKKTAKENTAATEQVTKK